MTTPRAGAAALPARRQPVTSDSIYQGALTVVSALVVVLLGLMIVTTVADSLPAWTRFGIVDFIAGQRWAPSFVVYGALPFIYGTLLTSAIALIVAVPTALLVALLITEFLPARIQTPVGVAVDLIAAVPSVVFGLWGLLVLVPLVRPVEQAVAASVGQVIPFFGPPTPGPSYFVAGLVVAFMIIPIVAALAREVFAATPRIQREAVFALGGTRWEVVRTVVLPMARPGILAAVILGLARAMGETIAVTMVVGNSPKIGASIFSPGFTLASVIANEFNEANQELHPESLIALGVVLLVISALVNGGAILVRQRFAQGGGR
jgi:phosphate transport system permease protein